VLSLFCVGQLNHDNGTLGTIESVQELVLLFSPIFNGFWLQVGIPIKGYTLQCPDELFYR